jgi:phosphate transport system substrate-binding protein
MIKRLSLIAALVATLGVSVASATDITGAGSSFVNPILSKWAGDYNKATGHKLNYQSIGSGAGIKQIDAKTVDFGASDMPLTDEDLVKKNQTQFPVVIGGVIPVINVAGIAPGSMKLTGELLAEIYLGKIQKWDDAAIKALNPGLALPDALIAPVRRSDGSGTTFLFTNYLSKVSPEWKTKVGFDTAVNWPVGLGGKGNEGVAAFVNRIPNSIGYTEYAYVKQNKMNYVKVSNSTGAYVEPDENSFKAAAANADWNKSFYQVLTNQAGKESWPITGATFVIMHKVQDKPEVAAEVLKFFDWGFKNGDKSANDLDYVTMPAPVKDSIRKSWGLIKDASGKSIAY